jgi:putative colanic acid biosynthesis acetyltransferase WcaF
VILKDNDPYRGPSFSLANRLLRVAWSVVSLLLFKPTPWFLYAWRAMLLRLFGARVGKGCHVYPRVAVWAPWHLTLGDHVGVANGVTLYAMDKIVIGDYAVISQGAHLCGGSHDYNRENFQLVAKPIEIGPHAWVCAEAFIHPGVVVPEGAVVGARAVVSKSLPEPWAVYAGNPCTRVGARKRPGSSKGEA